MGDTPKTSKDLSRVLKGFLEGFDPNGTDDDEAIVPEDGETLKSDEGPGEDKLIEELDQIYTPIIVSQELCEDAQDLILGALSEENVLTESNIIKFDADTRKAQLVALCALLLARQANSPDYDAYKQASITAKTMKLKIQRDHHAAAVTLANKYLQHVASTSNNSVVRDGAQKLGSVN